MQLPFLSPLGTEGVIRLVQGLCMCFVVELCGVCSVHVLRVLCRHTSGWSSSLPSIRGAGGHINFASVANCRAVAQILWLCLS